MIDLSKIYKKYKGQWVAFQTDQETVISNGKTAKEAYERAIKKGHSSPLMARMPDELANFIGCL